MGNSSLLFKMNPVDPNASVTEVRSYFVRGRNALLTRADFGAMYVDHYLHLADYGLRYSNEHDAMLKDAIAAMTLHLTSKPQDENCAWTLNFHDPLVNLFVTGKSRPGMVTGRVFTEDVRDFGKNVFISQFSRPNHPQLQSMIEFTTNDLFKSVEEFYAQSEQRLTRLFRYDEEDIIMISAEPDCDVEWLAALTLEDVKALDSTETLSLLEKREYIFHCGCSVERLYPMLAKLGEEDLNYLFEQDEAVTLTCPRCAARYVTPRTHFMAWKAAEEEV
jgi:molecular chaperone Hsp33